MRRAGIGSRSHGRHVGGFEDEDSRRARTAASRSHVDDNWHRRSHNFVDDFARRLDQSAGSVHLDQDGLIVVGGRRCERAANVFGGDGLNRVVDCDPQDVGGAEGGEQKEHCDAAGRMANPKLPRPPATAELRSAWTGEGARPYTSMPSEN